ncbi:hypothetical protein N7E81_01970 [Reichenbachiella carrageenanivorans]|uniref:Lipocalin-like domain-containing protein n=1 Tax=Reichenbachiella carrageenanivorans TaxID=2979869 RepID=A0ABY6D137_9BACT|nr:hypothetical protein [Reichenbachiella carrageenanivorans]UXX79871.1 hypothetical protein N7E81_01970 [Reichenbachiella carrageenanivorans]
MKKINPIHILLLVLLSALVGCGDDSSNIPEEEEHSRLIAGTWVLGENSQVLRDGNDITLDYQDFSIFFTEQFGYYAEGDPNNIIYPQGTWQYVDGNFGQIVLNEDERPIAVALAQDNTVLTITFTNDTNEPLGARSKGITGSYTFILSKE